MPVCCVFVPSRVDGRDSCSLWGVQGVDTLGIPGVVGVWRVVIRPFWAKEVDSWLVVEWHMAWERQQGLRGFAPLGLVASITSMLSVETFKRNNGCGIMLRRVYTRRGKVRLCLRQQRCLLGRNRRNMPSYQGRRVHEASFHYQASHLFLLAVCCWPTMTRCRGEEKVALFFCKRPGRRPGGGRNASSALHFTPGRMVECNLFALVFGIYS